MAQVYYSVHGGTVLGVLGDRDPEYEEGLRASGHKFKVLEVNDDAVKKDKDGVHQLHLHKVSAAGKLEEVIR